MANTVTLSLRALRRDWRSGELRILVAALVIAVASITTVGFFTDRVQQVMRAQGNELLGADLVLASSDPLDAKYAARAAENNLRTARTLSFRSAALAGERMQLVEVKAVSASYPLRGALRVSPRAFVRDFETRSVPARGEVWVGVRLLQSLDVQIAGAIRLGEAAFTITRVLSYEPDRAGDLFNIAPRVLMNIEDVPATQLIQPGSRVRHRLLLAGERDDVQVFRTWLRPRLATRERLLTLEEGRPQLRRALEKARQYLGLAALASVLLAGVAVAMAARRFARRHLDTAAIMRCLGATQGIIIKLFAWEMAWLALAASLGGAALGYAAQAVLARLLSGMVAGALPMPSVTPALIGVPMGVIVLIGFALPPLLALRHVSPLRVLRRDMGFIAPSNLAVYGVALAAMTALMAWQVRDLRLLAYVLGGVMVTLVLLGAVAYFLVRIMNGLRGRVGVAWRFGLANIARRGRASTAQIVAFGLGIMVLLLLSIVRGDLLEGWRRTIPEQAPNQFLINIQPDQVAGLRVFLGKRGVTAPDLYPMVRARLLAVNGRAVTAAVFAQPHGRRHALREFNLSWAARLQGDNRVIAGRWWRAEDSGRPFISLEKGLAEDLGIGLGDMLTFDVAGARLEVSVTNLRTVEWDSFNVNFFTVLPPGLLDDYPTTYITSFYLAPQRKDMLAELVRRFPNVTVIDVAALMTKVRFIMDRVILAVEYVFAFTVLAGLAVLFAAIQTTQDERRYEGAVLRTLGARRGQLLRSLLAEFATLGMLAGVLAGLTATVLGYVLAEYVFGFVYSLNPWLWLVGLVGGAVGIGIAGTLGTWSVLRQPPAKTLREV